MAALAAIPGPWFPGLQAEDLLYGTCANKRFGCEPELHPLSAEQVRAFLVSVEGDRLAPLYESAVALGMRQGELLALRWSDVDIDAGP